MKRTFTFLFILISSVSFGQDEFAATAFYSDFKKIYADAQAGFINYKGEKRQSEFEELNDEYNVKFLLPLADSGKIVFPNTANPYVVYYFEPGKNRLKVDQRAVSLREAVVTAYNAPLYSKSETVMINDRPLSNTWLFTTAEETKNAAALFRISIYFTDNRYYLSFEIRGKNQ